MAEAKKRIKRRKATAERKEHVIKVMVTSEQKREFADAAKAAGLDLSSWLRTLAIREAKSSGAGEGEKGEKK